MRTAIRLIHAKEHQISVHAGADAVGWDVGGFVELDDSGTPWPLHKGHEFRPVVSHCNKDS